MRVLDLFSGWGGWSAPWIDAGHDVITLDFDPKFHAFLQFTIEQFAGHPTKMLDMYVRNGWRPDVILASPPCESFTVMRIGANWTTTDQPKTKDAAYGLYLLSLTQVIVGILKPKYFILENPRAKMRRVVEHHWPELERRTVTYCQYGEDRMKPTDLWSDRWPSTLELRPTCKNGDPCHLRAPRGSTTGTQGGVPGDISAIIPRQLADQVMEAILDAENRAAADS